MEVLAPATRVKAPVFTIATGPVIVVMRSPLIEKAAPVKLMPPDAFVFKVLRVDVPVPAT